MNVWARSVLAGAAGVLIAGGLPLAYASPASASPRSLPACTTANLSAKATASGAGMSQPFTFITVTNISGAACRLQGYPSITAAWTKKGKVAIDPGHGIIQALDKWPRMIRLLPGGQAHFGIGTATAFDPPLVTLTKVAITTALGETSINVRINQAATAPTGKPIPISVTGYVAGKGTLQG